jgi:hypothetical protein
MQKLEINVGTVAGTVVLIDMSYERNNCMHE